MLGALVLALAVSDAASGVVTPEQAIAAAVAQRLGVSAAVVVEALDTDVEAAPNLVAEPQSTARIGRPSRFVLSAGRKRLGIAVATVRVTAPYPRAARALARDEAIGAADVILTHGELPPMRIRPILQRPDVEGLTTRRAIAAGEPLTEAVLWVPPVVRSGDEVEVTVRIGRVEVTGVGRASGSGQVGDTIRVKQPNSSRLLTGRITGPGAVEIVE